MRPNTNRFFLRKRKDDGDQSLIKFRTKRESKQATLSSPPPKNRASCRHYSMKALLPWERPDPCVCTALKIFQWVEMWRKKTVILMEPIPCNQPCLLCDYVLVFIKSS